MVYYHFVIFFRIKYSVLVVFSVGNTGSQTFLEDHPGSCNPPFIYSHLVRRIVSSNHIDPSSPRRHVHQPCIKQFEPAQEERSLHLPCELHNNVPRQWSVRSSPNTPRNQIGFRSDGLKWFWRNLTNLSTLFDTAQQNFKTEKRSSSLP